MPKKVRVLREMPYITVGDTWELDDDGSWEINCDRIFSPSEVIGLIGDYIEWVEELKSLGEKFNTAWANCDGDGLKLFLKSLPKLARSHYLEIFDKAETDHADLSDESMDDAINFIRKAIENN